MAEKVGSSHIDISLLVLVAALIIVSLSDLFSPPVTPTVWRQTQTAMLTKNYAESGFSLHGLFVNLRGNEKPLMVFEFPLFNFLAGLLFLLTGKLVLSGKVVSLLASLCSLAAFYGYLKERYGRDIAALSGSFFVLSPMGALMCTGFQPDGLALLSCILAWRRANRYYINGATIDFTWFSLLVLIGGLTKFPVVVPFVPLFLFFLLRRQAHRLFPREAIIGAIVFIMPFGTWFWLRRTLAEPQFAADDKVISMFLFGDLWRFFVPSYYLKPLLSLFGYLLSGVGALFLGACIKDINAERLLLLVGIPFYFLVIPTAADQPYYLFALLPAISVLMGEGFLKLFRRSAPVTIGVGLAYVVAFGLCTSYLMRQDWISLQAADLAKRWSTANDLVFVINTHDRGTGVGGANPTILFLSERKGWNVQNYDGNPTTALQQIENAKASGARWLLLTWYSEQYEPWLSKYLPDTFRRRPVFNGRMLLEPFRRSFSLREARPNSAIFELSPTRGD